MIDSPQSDVIWCPEGNYRFTILEADIVIRDFFLGSIKIHILYHAAKEPVYGVALIRELAHHGYALSPGTLYPLLHALEESGLLNREDRVVKGRRRKYYAATPAGVATLDAAKIKIHELFLEVVEDKEPDPDDN